MIPAARAVVPKPARPASKTTTRRPDWARRSAAQSPTMPAPTTMTSTLDGTGPGPTDCPVSGTQITCALPDGDSWTAIEVIVEPTGGATDGTHGAVSITAKADNADTTTTTS